MAVATVGQPQRAKTNGPSRPVQRVPGFWIALFSIGVLLFSFFTSLNAGDGFDSGLLSGLLILLVGYLLSSIYTRDSMPWALARKPTASDVGQFDRDGDGYQTVKSATPGDSLFLPITTNDSVSLSKLQLLLYFAVVIFVYVFTFMFRYVEAGVTTPLPRIPLEVLGLIGLSVGTTLGSQALSLRYQSENKVGEADRSDLIKNRDGNADLTKVQMLLWTVVSLAVYLTSFFQLTNTGCYTHDYKVAAAGVSAGPSPTQMSLCKAVWDNYQGSRSGQDEQQTSVPVEPSPSFEQVATGEARIPAWQSLGPLLPRFDVMLLLLAGIVQGTYLAGRFVTTRNKPKIDGVYRMTSGNDSLVRIIGVFEGIRAQTHVKDGATHTLYNAMLEVTGSQGDAYLVNLGDSATLNTTKSSDNLDSTVKDVKAGPTAFILTNLLPSNEYTFRVSVDGVWSDAVLSKLA